MKNKIITVLIAFLLLANMTSAVISYYQEDIFLSTDPHITRTVASTFWSEGEYLDVNDAITDDDLLEVTIYYSMYPKTWNTQNPEYYIDNCTFTINYFENKLNESYVYYNETIFAEDSDVLGDKYFVRLKQKDGISVFLDCSFENETQRIIDTPTELNIILPTWECKACQYYEWSKLQRDIAKSETIGSNTVTIWGYIKELISINFEIILAGFWLFLIIVALMGSGLIFIGIYYMYVFLRRIAKDIR